MSWFYSRLQVLYERGILQQVKSSKILFFDDWGGGGGGEIEKSVEKPLGALVGASLAILP